MSMESAKNAPDTLFQKGRNENMIFVLDNFLEHKKNNQTIYANIEIDINSRFQILNKCWCFVVVFVHQVCFQTQFMPVSLRENVKIK